MSNISELHQTALDYLASDVYDAGDYLETDARDMLYTLTLTPEELIADGYLDPDDRDDDARAYALAAAAIDDLGTLTPDEALEAMFLDDPAETVECRLDDISLAVFNRPGLGYVLLPGARALNGAEKVGC